MGFKNSPAFKYINFGISFGITIAITVYVLFLGGRWLDDRLGTAPLFMFLGVVIGVAAVFKRLITDLKTLDQKPGDNGDENKTG